MRSIDQAVTTATANNQEEYSPSADAPQDQPEVVTVIAQPEGDSLHTLQELLLRLRVGLLLRGGASAAGPRPAKRSGSRQSRRPNSNALQRAERDDKAAARIAQPEEPPNPMEGIAEEAQSRINQDLLMLESGTRTKALPRRLAV